MVDAASGSRLGKHAVYPGTFDPVTPGHLDIISRARDLFARVTVLVAVNGEKQPVRAQEERVIQLRRTLSASWDNVSVRGWAGLTAAFCREHGAGVIIRGVRDGSDLRHEYQLAAMNQEMGITTLLLPANPGLAGVSSTLMRGIAAGGNLPDYPGSNDSRRPPGRAVSRIAAGPGSGSGCCPGRGWSG
jgi:pantetheine-phosphate adenylyltransferase